MAREKWLKKAGAEAPTAAGRNRNTESKAAADTAESAAAAAAAAPASRSTKKYKNKRGTPALLDFVRATDWSGALSRCASHPDEVVRFARDYDCRAGHMQPPPLHYVLLGRPRRWTDSNSSDQDDGDGCANREEEDSYMEFLEKVMAADPEALTSTDVRGYTPLHAACAADAYAPEVRAILRRCPPVDASELRSILEGGRGSSNSSSSGSKGGGSSCSLPVPPLEVLRTVLAYVPNPALMRDRQGKTPLLLACQWSKNRRNRRPPSAEVVSMLLARAPGARSIADNTGRTPLQVVLQQRKFLSLVDLLA